MSVTNPPRAPSGHPVAYPLLKPNSHFQVDFRHQLEFHQPWVRGLGLGHANRGRAISLNKLACACLLREPNPTYGSQFRLAIHPLTLGRGFTTAKPKTRDTTFHIYASAALCKEPSPLGSWAETLSGIPDFSPRNSRDLISLTRYPIGVFFSLLESSSL